MKKYLQPLAIIIMMVAGCKLDEAGFPKPGENLILGKWYNKSTTTYTPPQNGLLLSVSIDNNFTSSDYIQFSGNTVTKSMTGLGTGTLNYTISGSTLTLTSTTDPTDIETSTISKLTADSLVLVSTFSLTAGTVVNTSTITERFARK
jgi:hypothetical protein